MREILFRGRTPKGEWIEGKGVDLCFGIPFILTEKRDCATMKSRVDKTFVSPETVGQYTGFKDKIGKRVFEGDIIKCEELYDAGQYPKYVTIVLPVVYAGGAFRPLTRCEPGSIEVIGNIHDNPELLE